MFLVFQMLVHFLKDVYNVFDTRNIEALDEFISKYINSEINSLAQYAKGIQGDYDVVKNSLLYPDISHGPIEGINSRIKMKHRRSADREGLELPNAYMVIPIKLINPYIRL